MDLVSKDLRLERKHCYHSWVHKTIKSKTRKNVYSVLDVQFTSKKFVTVENYVQQNVNMLLLVLLIDVWSNRLVVEKEKFIA